MVPLISLIAVTDSCVAAWMPVICWPISPVAFAVCSASAFTSEATTAKPRPASPARAASMVAFSASRLVCPAMVLISSTTSPMRLAAFDNSLTRSLVTRAWPTASLAIRADSCTWRLISLTEEDSSSVAEATDCTLVEASSEAAATAVVSCCERSAVDDSVPAEASSWVEAEDTVWTISPIIDFEIAGDAVDPAAALDLGFGVRRGSLVGGLLGDQRFLEHLQGVGHGADFGLLALMRHVRAQVALAQRLHRVDDGGDAGRDVANQIEADADADDHGGAEDDGENHEGRGVAVGGILGRLVGAGVVEVDILLQDVVGLDPDLVDGLGIQFVRLMRNLAGGLARQRHDFLRALLVGIPVAWTTRYRAHVLPAM